MLIFCANINALYLILIYLNLFSFRHSDSRSVAKSFKTENERFENVLIFPLHQNASASN